jgi:hypothetical protein
VLGGGVMLRPNPLLPGGAVAVIDRTLARMRVDICTVQGPVHTQDAGGAPVRGYGTTGVYDCRVVRAGTVAGESVTGDRFTADAAYEVRLPRHAIVSNNDRIVVDDTVLEVTGPTDVATSGQELAVPVSVRS